MALDALVVNSITNELKTKILNGKIDKIYQPEIMPPWNITIYNRNNK